MGSLLNAPHDEETRNPGHEQSGCQEPDSFSVCVPERHLFPRTYAEDSQPLRSPSSEVSHRLLSGANAVKVGADRLKQFGHTIEFAGVLLVEVHALFLRQFREDWFVRIARSDRDLHTVRATSPSGIEKLRSSA